jgi:GntR family transcriptional regulator/MocR family aminotransferase
MESGDFARHIRRMRRAYSTRQKALLAALAAEAQGLLVAEPDPAGMHLIAKLTPDLAARMTDRDVETRGAEAGVIARALSNYYTEGPPQQGLVLGYAGFDEAALAVGVAKLAAALR